MASDLRAPSGPDPFPAASSVAVAVGAVCWTLSAAFFVVQGVAQAAFTPGFDMARNLISDLGNTACGPALCSPLHTLVNATFAAVGALQWAGAVATSRAWPRSRVSLPARAVLALAGALLIVVGMHPENESAVVHTIAALAGIVSLNLAVIGLGVSVLASRRWLGATSLAAGVLGLTGTALFLSATGPSGVTERLADYPGAAMVAVFGAVLLASTAARRRRAGVTPRP